MKRWTRSGCKAITRRFSLFLITFVVVDVVDSNDAYGTRSLVCVTPQNQQIFIFFFRCRRHSLIFAHSLFPFSFYFLVSISLFDVEKHADING